jgi:hypothetical protein
MDKSVSWSTRQERRQFSQIPSTLTSDRERGKSANLGCVASLSQGPHSGKKVKSQLVVYQRVILTSDRSACHQQYRAHLPRLTASINAIDSGLK